MHRIAAIGDIHGCADELINLLKQLQDKVDEYVFLGDYLDKGPNELEVLKILKAWNYLHPCVFILGNHEWKHLRRREHKLLDENDYEWLIDNTQLTYTVKGDYNLLFSHAGFYLPEKYFPSVRELLSMKGKERDKYTQVLYIRDVWEDGKQISFDINNPNQGKHWSTNSHYLDRIRPKTYVFHGHAAIFDTNLPSIIELDNKKIINLDTGCYETGCLTAAVITNNEIEFFRTYGTK